MDLDYRYFPEHRGPPPRGFGVLSSPNGLGLTSIVGLISEMGAIHTRAYNRFIRAGATDIADPGERRHPPHGSQRSRHPIRNRRLTQPQEQELDWESGSAGPSLLVDLTSGRCSRPARASLFDQRLHAEGEGAFLVHWGSKTTGKA